MLSPIERDHHRSIRWIDRFSRLLDRLRSDPARQRFACLAGPIRLRSEASRRLTGHAFKKRLKEIRRVLGLLRKDCSRHMELEERHLFPFLKKHIPRIEPMLFFLGAEHRECRSHFKALDSLLKHATSRAGLGEWWDDFYHRGLYLIGLLRSHANIESRNLHRFIEYELQDEEKKDLSRRLRAAREALGSH